jgi:hypothetical protein
VLAEPIDLAAAIGGHATLNAVAIAAIIIPPKSQANAEPH